MAGVAPAMRRSPSWGYALFLSLFLTLPLSITVDAAELLIPVPENGICKSLDIRNTIESLKQLEGCQVIEGSLQIILFDKANETDFGDISFPELVEITDYLLLFRVNGLKSIGQLFPNLAVIRGQHLFPGNKALVIFEMSSLQEIGLHSLTTIMNGVVYIDKNPSLCFATSIDWDKIIYSDDKYYQKMKFDEKTPAIFNTYVKSFKPDNECPVCPATINGKGCPRSEKDNNKYLCWNRHHCQKICTGCGRSSCNEQGQCCEPRCLGGCGFDTSKCTVCREFALSTGERESKCVQKCPSNFLAFLERRCVTRVECVSMAKPILEVEEDEPESTINVDHPYKIHEGACLLHCPPYFSGNYTDHSCNKCNNTCRKDCPGARIDSINLAVNLKGCTHIKGSVEIQIRGGDQVVKSLQENLGMIEEIDGYLKIVRSFSLVSLNFFKNLKRIRGNSLESELYSFIVLDNQNLQELFDWKDHKEFKIDKGTLFFHFNPKLCIDKIEELRKNANLPMFTELEVATNSNGDKVACRVSQLEISIHSVSSKSAVLEWNPFEIDDPRKLLSYIVYSIEAPTKNVNFFDGRDACGQDNWHVDDVPNNFDTNKVSHSLTNLKPFTQYAIFVKTYTIATEKNGAQSDIIYFKTKASQPSEPFGISVTGISSDSLYIQWRSPAFPNGRISYYIVTGIKQEYQTNLPNRNYCVDSVVPEVPKKTTTMAPKKTTHPDCSGSKSKLDPKVINEQEEVARIDFENALHNRVYIKRKSFNRTRRYIEDIYDNNFSSGSISNRPLIPTKNIPDYLIFNNGSYPRYLDKIIVPNTTEPNGNVMKTFTYFVKNPKVTLAIKDLHHFTVYNIALRACRDVERDDQEPVCSESAEVSGETLEKKGADNITNVTILNTTSDSVTVRWEQPKDPNRMIASVIILYRREGTKNVIQGTMAPPPRVTKGELSLSPNVRYDDMRSIRLGISLASYVLSPIFCMASGDTLRLWSENGDSGYKTSIYSYISQYIGECISYKDFKNYTRDNRYMVYTIPRLFPGNHSLYLKTTSLYGVSEPSPIINFYIQETGSNIAVVLSVTLMSIFILGAIAVWFFYKKTIKEKGMMLVPAVNPEYMSVYMLDEWEVPRKNIVLIEELGQGSFGMVWEGVGHDFKDVKGSVRCAVKTVNAHATSRERVDFLNEASVMKAFNTTHVVKLLGVVSQGQPALVIMELMVNGDLKTYLRTQRPENNDGKSPPSLKQLLRMAIEIADGMAYLESKKFVHRDLAARNCMVAEDLTVKIGDFGMTRDIYETDYYRKGSRGLLPVRWMAPESLKDGVFSSSSDAWSYGVVLWEMATLASQPYQGLSNEQALRYIMEGGLMERPEDCPDKLYEIMKLCWNLKPGRRPTFMQLCEMLLPDSDELFSRVSFYHSEEGREARAIRAATNPSTKSNIPEAGDGDEADASTPLNALPPDVRIVDAYAMSTSERSDSIQSVHMDPNPRFYSISEDRTANGFVGAIRAKNGKAQSQC